MSTPVGHSWRQALQPTQSAMAAAMSGEVKASGPSWPDERQPEAVGAAPGQVLLVAGGAVARAHRAAGELAAGAVAVAHLDGAGEAAPVRPVERRRRAARRPRSRRRSGAARGRPSRTARTILPGFRRPAGSKASLTASKARTRRGPNMRSWNSEREMPSPCSPECEPSKRRTSSKASSAIARIARRPAGCVQVEDRAHVQAADRGVGVPGAAGAVAGEELGDRLGVVGEVVERHGAVLDEADRLGVALGRHHDVEAGLAHLPDGALSRRVGHLDDGVGEAVVGHAGVEAFEAAP